MKHLKDIFYIKNNSGFVGVLVCSVLSFGLSMAAVQSTLRSNMDNYHAPTKVKIEVAGQLSHSGLRYGRYLLEDDTRLWNFFNAFASDPAVTIACSATVALPEDLVATKTMQVLPTPYANQEIKIRGIIAPYNCNEPLTQTNYRLTLEVVGEVDCLSGEEQSDNCVTRSIVQTAYQGTTYQPIITTAEEPVYEITCPKESSFSAPMDLLLKIFEACAKVGRYFTLVPPEQVATFPPSSPVFNNDNVPKSLSSTSSSSTSTTNTQTTTKNSTVGM